MGINIMSVTNKILAGENIRKVMMESDELKPSEIVKNNWPKNSNKMCSFDIDGKVVQTNLGAFQYPMLRGYENGYGKLDMNKTPETTFDELVAKGYKYIRFARMATSIRGYNHIYVLYK